MTPEEAIAKLERLQDPEPWEPQIDSETFEALEMGIEALRKQDFPTQMSGTSGSESIMTTEEIIKTLKTAQAEVEWEYPMDYAVAIDEAIDAVYVRDEVEKKLKLHHLRIELKAALRMILERAKERAAGKHYWTVFGDLLKCPVCGHYFKDAYDMENTDNYCRHCGAKMERIRPTE